jgi:hypothetical protein
MCVCMYVKREEKRERERERGREREGEGEACSDDLGVRTSAHVRCHDIDALLLNLNRHTTL